MITQTKVLTANPEMVELFFKRAKKGAAALRTKLGKTWYRRICTSALMMDSEFSCVLGQAFKDYADGVLVMMGKAPTGKGMLTTKEHIWANKHGFVLFEGDTQLADVDKDIRFATHYDTIYAYGVLGDVWREVIKAERRKVKK